VVTVNFNAGPLLTEAVRAVLASTEPVEVIVVDNGSSDDSLRRLRAAVGSDPRLRIEEMGTNLGFARASNHGLARARGDTGDYTDLRDRYRDMARTLEFEGHIAWAEAMP